MDRVSSDHAEWPVLQIEGVPVAPVVTEGDVIFRVSVSASVYIEQVQSIIEQPIASVHLYLGKPDLDLVRTEEQLNSYAHTFRQTLSDILHLAPNVKCVHLFFAGPPTLAFRCGQQISKTMDPEVIVYNYSRRDTPAYRWSLNLCTGQIIDRNANSPEEDQL